MDEGWRLVQAASIAPLIALVDLDASTPHGRPLWSAVEHAYRCPIVLITTVDGACQAADTVKDRGLYEYILTTAVEDPARLPFLIGRSGSVTRHDGLPPQARGGWDGPILVLEDDEVSGELTRGILEQNGFEVVLVRTIAEARLAFVRHRPILALVDVHLDHDNGIDFVRAMRNNSAWPHTPVIMVSSDQHRSTVIDAGRAEVQGYLVKPYEPAALIGKIQAALV